MSAGDTTKNLWDNLGELVSVELTGEQVVLEEEVVSYENGRR